MSLFNKTRLERAQTYLEQAKKTFTHLNKLRHRLKRAEKFLFDKRRELAQAHLNEWPKKVASFYNVFRDEVNEACEDTQRALSERDLNKKMSLITSAWEHAERAIKFDERARKLMKKEIHTSAEKHLK